MSISINRRHFLMTSLAAATIGKSRFSRADNSSPSLITPTLNDYLTAQISASALKTNIELIRRELKPTTKLCFVAKSNCYAHGWLQCQDAIKPFADWVAVATPAEALAIRHSGWQRPILLLMASGLTGIISNERLRRLIARDVTLTLADPNDLPVIAAAARAAGRPAQLHLKIDSGMTRSGVMPDKAPALMQQARQQTDVALTGVYTHFAAADEKDKSSAYKQLACFMAAIQASGKNAEGLLRHAAASAATIDLPESHFDMVRVGTAIYGHQPSDEMLRTLPLRGVMRLVSRLTQVKEVPAGRRVSYGQTYGFEKPAKIGLVPIGYSDGYCRAFSNRAMMKVGEQYVPVRGRVCMDQTIVELTGLPDVKVGDAIEIVSPDAAAPNSIENLARLANTITPDIMVGFGSSRIQRVTTT